MDAASISNKTTDTPATDLSAGTHIEPALSWRLADLSVLGLWLLVVAVTVFHHEMWADEAQAWLLARDLNLRTLWFSELRYEGNPGLWHFLLWLAQRLFHVPYSGLGVIGLLCAAAGIALMLLRAPFPRPVRWLLAFSYYMVYQYAVIARPYVLLPLLGFSAAILFKDVYHPGWMAIALALLANVSLHGALMAACIGLAFMLQAIGCWNALNVRIRRHFVLSAGALLLVVLLLFAILKPPSDAMSLRQVHTAFSVLGLTAWQGVNGAFFDSAPLTLGWLVLIGAWCFLARGANSFLTPLLILVMGVLYGIYGAPHHQGTILIAAITGLWIGWPTKQETQKFSVQGRWIHQALVAGLACLLGYQVWNASVAIRNDYRYSYCGAEDTAKYLKSVGADHRPLMGYGYAMVAVQAYFDHNIQLNRPTAYFHNGSPFLQASADQAGELRSYAPDYAVVPCWEDCEAAFHKDIEPFMHANGFALVHFSDGYLFDKRGYDVRQAYLIYHRK
jgi:hypothetical protein